MTEFSFVLSQDAKKAVRFYHNIRKDDKDYELIQSEMNKLRRINDGGETGQQKLNPAQFKYCDLLVGPGRKALTIGIVLMILNQFCGCFAMLNYNIFKEAGSDMPANVAAIIVGVIQLIGACFPVFLVERTGRKVCEYLRCFKFPIASVFFDQIYRLVAYSFCLSHLRWVLPAV